MSKGKVDAPTDIYRIVMTRTKIDTLQAVMQKCSKSTNWLPGGFFVCCIFTGGLICGGGLHAWQYCYLGLNEHILPTFPCLVYSGFYEDPHT